MKVVQLTTSDTGGAGIAALRLHRALLAQQVDSFFLSLWQQSKNKNQLNMGDTRPNIAVRVFSKLGFTLTQEAKAKKTLSQKKGNYEIFTFPETDHRAEQHPILQQADIINLHWISWFVNYPTFFNINKPLVWTLHDFNPLMGGFHYPADNSRNREQLGAMEDALRIRKQHIIQQRTPNNLCIVTPSKWLGDLAKKSDTFSKFEVVVIPNSIDTGTFKPHDQQFARSVFNLPANKRILLFVSETIENYRKGFDLLANALSALNLDNSTMLVTVGNTTPALFQSENIINIGSVHDERLMALLYSAADAFILPSREDNLPNVMLESIACGTPVIAFRTGGIPEVITSGKNGILADEISANALAAAIQQFISGVFEFNRILIHKEAAEHFSPEIQSAAYLSLYHRLMENHSRNEA